MQRKQEAYENAYLIPARQPKDQREYQQCVYAMQKNISEMITRGTQLKGCEIDHVGKHSERLIIAILEQEIILHVVDTEMP